MTTHIILRWILASLHLFALGIGLGAIFTRAYLLQRLETARSLRGVFLADTFWGLAAMLWITTGLVRAFGGFEKGSLYYVHSSSFWIKMAMLFAILLLEVWPVLTLFHWRLLGTETLPPRKTAIRLAWISRIQTVLVIAMIVAATAMARGLNP